MRSAAQPFDADLPHSHGTVTGVMVSHQAATIAVEQAQSLRRAADLVVVEESPAARTGRQFTHIQVWLPVQALLRHARKLITGLSCSRLSSGHSCSPH